MRVAAHAVRAQEPKSITVALPVASRQACYEFWRYVFVQKEIAQAAQTFIDFPPMQKGASFNLEALKEEMEKRAAAQTAQ